jgi:serine/threonine-protein kinase RsbT
MALGFSLVDQTKVITAASELARNALVHGGGGEAVLEDVRDGWRTGLRILFRDEGPGIENLDQALKDGFSSGSGLGLGLSGSRRLVNEFDLQSAPGTGTRVTIVKWK